VPRFFLLITLLAALKLRYPRPMATQSSSIPAFINGLMCSEVYPHQCSNIQLIETHISWVILTGAVVYKIKKPVNFGFLDFSQLEKRKYFCEEELRLNKRLAPDIYLQVVAIGGTEAQPRICNDETVFEYAVKMKQFPQSAQLDNLLAHGDLHPDYIDAVAICLAQFHNQIDIADTNDAFGDYDHVVSPCLENFKHIRHLIKNKTISNMLDHLEIWTHSHAALLKKVIVYRKKNGFVRECHGDLHLRNMAWLENKPILFDCIEFNTDLRWIDVMSEVAFVLMDLHDRRLLELSTRFLNTYLQQTGDYSGLKVLRFYVVYRALVRSKVAALRAAQFAETGDAFDSCVDEVKEYLQLAHGFTHVSKPILLLMHGPSASGKSTVSEILMNQLGAIRLRSDVERKRLFQVAPDEPSENAFGAGIYSSQATCATYLRLLDLSERILRDGFSVIVDAKFQTKDERVAFINLAKSLSLDVRICHLNVSKETLMRRITQRKNDISDANETVLTKQLSHWQGLSDNELTIAINIDANDNYDLNAAIRELRDLSALP